MNRLSVQFAMLPNWGWKNNIINSSTETIYIGITNIRNNDDKSLRFVVVNFFKLSLLISY